MTTTLAQLQWTPLKAGFSVNSDSPSANALNTLLNQIGAYANICGTALNVTFTPVSTIALTNEVLEA